MFCSDKEVYTRLFNSIEQVSIEIMDPPLQVTLLVGLVRISSCCPRVQVLWEVSREL